MKVVYGGGERDRTDDPLLAKQVLSQLSYTPGRKTDNLRVQIRPEPSSVLSSPSGTPTFYRL